VPAIFGDSSPASASRLSVIVVLPWSMWAMMPTLRMFCLWLIRRSMSVVCLKRGIVLCFLSG
jgi:hypothetical protein